LKEEYQEMMYLLGFSAVRDSAFMSGLSRSLKGALLV